MFFRTHTFNVLRKNIFHNFRSLTTLHKSHNNKYYNNTVKDMYFYWKKVFNESKISEAKESITYILAHIFKTENISDVYKKFSNKLNQSQIQQLHKLCELRLKGMPIQYILGEWNFCGAVLKMQPPVFIPRPETEELVNIVLKHMDTNKIYNILELCCGSGAISIALLKSNLNIKITAIDQSIDACNLTTINARMHQVDERLKILNYQISEKHMLEEIVENFDMIVTNPPYVPTAQVDQVQSEIKLYEDLNALDGGNDGLSVIKSILNLANKKLVTKGKLFIETDTSHPTLIEEWIQRNSDTKLKYINSFKDFCKKDRFVLLIKM